MALVTGPSLRVACARLPLWSLPLFWHLIQEDLNRQEQNSRHAPIQGEAGKQEPLGHTKPPPTTPHFSIEYPDSRGASCHGLGDRWEHGEGELQGHIPQEEALTRLWPWCWRSPIAHSRHISLLKNSSSAPEARLTEGKTSAQIIVFALKTLSGCQHDLRLGISR